MIMMIIIMIIIIIITISIIIIITVNNINNNNDYDNDNNLITFTIRKCIIHYPLFIIITVLTQNYGLQLLLLLLLRGYQASKHW